MKKNFIWILNAILLVAFIGISAVLYNTLTEKYSADNQQAQTDSTIPAPDFTVLDMDGNPVRLSDFKGKPVVLNFWATWCYYCKKEMPDFDEAAKLFPDVQFMMVNATDGVQETEEMAKKYLNESGFGYFDVFFDTQLEAVNAYRITGFPATIFVDRDGNIVSRANGMINMDALKQGIAIIK